MSVAQRPQGRTVNDQPRSRPVKHRLDGVNRTVLLLLALVLVAGGVLTLLVGIGQLVLQPGSPLVPGDAVDRLVQRPWLWWVGAGAALVAAVLGLVWLIAQLRTDGVAGLDLEVPGADGGITTVRSSGLTEAVEVDAESIAGVERAHARVAGHRERRVELTVVLTEDADITRVRREVEERTVAHLRGALDAPGLPVHVELRVGAHDARRRTVR